MTKTWLFLTAIYVALAAQCEPKRSALGISGEKYAMEPTAVSAASYVQDCLIAQWDGIENAGNLIHDDSSPIWVDLVGNHDATLTGNAEWAKNALVCLGGTYAANADSALNRANVAQVEIVFESYGDGIVASLAKGSLDSTISVELVSGELMAMSVSKGSLGLKNRITGLEANKLYSVSLQYSSTDFILAFVNGTTTYPYYRFGTNDFSTLCFGGRAQWTDRPCTGRIHSVRVYSRQLSESEVAYNLSIDQERFGVGI